MLKQRIFKEWITTALGLALLAGAAYMLWRGRITIGEFTAFVPMCIGLLWAKNSFLTDLSKISKATAVVVLVLTLNGCQTAKHVIEPIQPTIHTSNTTSTVSSGGETQEGYTKPDSASMKALLACDSLGNVYIRQITELQMGIHIKPKVMIKDNYVYVNCKVDSLQVYHKWMRFYTRETDTLKVTTYLPGEVTNHLTWLQKLLIKCGWVFIASITLVVIYLIIKFKNPLKLT